MYPEDLSPSEVLVARSDAFGRGDFGFIFDSCHSDSNFRRQFPEREEYVRYGKSSLAAEYRILDCRILAEEIDADEARVIFLIKMVAMGELQRYAELAWLRQEEGEWRYHRGQRMAADEMPADPNSISFADFSRLDHSTIF